MHLKEDEVRQAARTLFRTEQGGEAWLELHNKRLGTTPLEALNAGRADEVLEELRFIAQQAGPQRSNQNLSDWISSVLGLGARK